MHDRRDGVEERQRVLAGQRADRVGQRGRGEGAGGDDDAVPIVRRQRHLLAADLDQRMRRQRLRDGRGKAVAIDRQRAAGRNLMGVGGPHDQRAEPPHFLMQQADGVGFPVVGAERVGAHQFGQAVGLVDLGAAHRPHFVQHGRHAARRDLPRGLAAGEAAADNVNGLLLCRCHEQYLAHGPAKWEPVIMGGEAECGSSLSLRGRWLPASQWEPAAAAAIEMSPAIAQLYTLGGNSAAERQPDDGLLRLRLPAALHPRLHPGRPAGADRLLNKGKASPEAERKAVQLAVQWLDRRMGPILNTTKRLARADFRHRDDDRNYDCYDTTRNAVSLLLVLREWGLLRHHTISDPEYRGRFLLGQTPHNTAVLKDRKSGTEWVVDLWTKAYGELPDVMTVEKWLKED